MFCVNCGASIEGNVLAACSACGKPSAPALSGADVGRMIKDASSDALAAIRQVAADPIGGLASSYSKLGERRARSAGLAFGFAFAITCAIAGVLAASKLGATGGFKVALGVVITALVPFIAIAATSAGARKVLGGTGALSADIFTAGVALQPVGLFFLLASILGSENWAAIALLSLFAWTYMTCILFAGTTRLAGLAERFAPLVIAAMLLAAMWLTKVTTTAMFEPTSPLGRLFN